MWYELFLTTPMGTPKAQPNQEHRAIPKERGEDAERYGGASLVWSDAAQNNRPKKGSTVGIVGAMAPLEILDGKRVPMNIV